ncbi:MAG: serine/threonine protein phosphatase [Candidatus Nezhaarchaeota archaeon]|nr:serine/threonine protein phosphatase [Candidatus Nezhaarchaeota archaeon]MCX8142136.1 serine/threonine protein phosphatase [Candidatus Nezhaarchaeota archaeon]MDW8050083.1 metallophosphoesterase family protein [Nitrososphaerota archaeon]
MRDSPSYEEFMELAYKVRELLRRERSRGGVGKYLSLGSLVKIKDDIDRLVVIGDIHGDYDGLTKILLKAGLKNHFPDNTVLVFLGDYIDRGVKSPHVVYEVFKLKLQHSDFVVLLRGNHEGPPELPVYPHDFPIHLNYIYLERWKELYESIVNCFNNFYACAFLEGSLFMVHGGPPTKFTRLEDLIRAHEDISTIEELLWNDPMEHKGKIPSPRGAGYLFGPDVTDYFLKTIGAKVIVRSHEPCDEGYEVHHGGKLITIFSRKGYPYHNSNAAYLDIHKPSLIENAFQLARECVRVF